MTAISIHGECEATTTGDGEQALVQSANSAREQRRRLRLLRKRLREGTAPSRTASIARPHESPQMLMAGSFGSRII
ncbi:hypothetical protein BJ956_001962 [Arthrobacter psychrochitiniphilus]|nr:hypothetical protein [Arthrobacter psychrochitiniphilus]